MTGLPDAETSPIPVSIPNAAVVEAGQARTACPYEIRSSCPSCPSARLPVYVVRYRFGQEATSE